MGRMALNSSGRIFGIFGNFAFLYLCFGSATALSQTDATTQKAVRIWQTEIHLGNITHAYPDSVWRRITSSVPRRPHALSRVNLSLASEFVLLTGASSSGKSTLFRLLLDDEYPSASGKIEIVGSSTRPPCIIPTDTTSGIRVRVTADMESELRPTWTAIPVLLEEKAVFPSGRETPRQNLLRCCCYSTGINASVVAVLVDGMAQSFRAQDWMDTTTELSQSQLLVWKLIEAALASSLQGFSVPKDNPVPDGCCDLPASILLLDEWLDKETTVVIRKVQESLESVAETTGAIIMCATHVPDRFSPCRQITLQNGRLLSDVARREPA
jgi:energy-coupling factor transporter ATP-binding protein EcfA2